MRAFRQAETSPPELPPLDADGAAVRRPAPPEPPPPSGPRRGVGGRRARRFRRVVRMSGYVPRNPAVYRAWNLALVVPLIVLCLPVLLGLAAALALSQGPRNIFYRGERIGRKGRPFHIIKFKTLRNDAARLTRDRVLPPGTRVETRLGRHLRDTRLDELPQLFNVLAGDMNLLGPRPVRPGIAAHCRRSIRGYDARFKVKPGLVGYTQALMPHGADKAIRARINAMLCRRHVNLVQEVLFLAITACAVGSWTLRVLGRQWVAWTRRGAAPAGARPYAGAARVAMPEGAQVGMELLSIDRSTLRLQSPQPLASSGPYSVSLRRGFRFRGGRWKSARCTAVVLDSRQVGDGPAGRRRMYRYTLRYRPASPLHDYLIQRYMLGGVLVR